MSRKTLPESTKQEQKTEKPDKRGVVICGIRGPGPKYLLKTLVGHDDHCLSRYRNPAYSFGLRPPAIQICHGPGPKYLLSEPKGGGFSFGIRGRQFDVFCGPGPKYILPVPKGLAFKIKSRTKHRQQCSGPGPYNVKHPRQGPSFYIAHRLRGRQLDCTPGPKPFSIDLVTQKPPIYSFGLKLGTKAICHSPGPKYHPKLDPPTPQYSFGTKHSECAPPYIVECDEVC